jgi:anti-anti-sigma factor
MTDASKDGSASVELAWVAVAVEVRGEVDLSTADRFAEGLRAASSLRDGDLVLDLRSLVFMDSSGLHALIETANQFGPARTIILRGARGGVRRLLKIAGIRRIDGFRLED